MLKIPSLLKKTLFSVARVYLLFCVALFVFQGNLIFFPQTEGIDLWKANIEALQVDTDGVVLEGYIKRSVGSGSVLYFWGNAEEISYFMAITSYSGNLIAFNYRGYGKSTGVPSEKHLFHDALFIYDDLARAGIIDPKNTVIMGRSLGTWVATYLASQRDSSGLILVTPFDSLEAVAREKYAIFPIFLLLRHRFLSVEYLKNYSHPTLIISGGRDRTITNEHTDRLILSMSEKVQNIRIKDADHNDILDFPESDAAIRKFLWENLSYAPLSR